MKPVRETYNQMKASGIVKTQREFSRLCGRRGSWTSSSISRNKAMSLDTMLYCYMRVMEARDHAATNSRLEKTESLNQTLNDIWHVICCDIEHRHLNLSRT